MSVNDDFSTADAVADTSGTISHPCLSAASFWVPAHFVESAWLEHGPFAFWLIEALRPRNFVELGTHNGFSYLTICQAVQRLGLSTACYAVDSWAGDEHAGFYGEEVFSRLSATNDQWYRGFSTLVRGSFSSALPYFTDGSVDLLHIDGRHGYEDVLADYESWRPKLSDRAIVLFHDTNVRERGFGVWRLWHELRDKYPSFEFLHGHGLGVLAVGAAIPSELRSLVFASIEQRALIQAIYARLGGTVADHYQLIKTQPFIQEAAHLNGVTAAQDAEIRNLRNEIDRLTGDTKQFHDHSALRETEWAHIQAEIARITVDRDQLKELSEALNAKILLLTNEASERAAELQEFHRLNEQERRATARLNAESTKQKKVLQLENSDQKRVIAKLGADLLAAQERNEALRADIQLLSNNHAEAVQAVRLIQQSASWRVTAPVRRLLDRFPTLHIATRRTAKLLWWTVTGQLLRRIKARIEARRQVTLVGAQQSAMPLALPGGDDRKRAMRDGLNSQLLAFLASGSRFTLPTSLRPEVSIILVLHNQAELTFGCLNSIKACRMETDPRIEVIILDNRSTDSTSQLLDLIDGAVIIRSEENLHFLRGVNKAAEHASGRNLLLLNNDAQLLPGSLSAALETLDSSPTIGAVGARIILPDGRLQEAGSIIWQDGTCTGYARGRAPEAPEAMFRRDVDYCSGAFLLTPRHLFFQLNGFDERFAPAYYEETDYCVRLLERGFRVVYDPDAVILHFEFGSTAANALELQQRNLHVFRDCHQAWLSTQLAFQPQRVIAARTRASTAKRILLIEDRVPHVDLGSGYPRANDLLRILAEDAAVTLFPMFPNAETWAGIRRSVPRDVEVMLGESASTLEKFLSDRRDLFEAIIVCRPHNMRRFIEATRRDPSVIGHAKVIYDAEALFAPREAQKRALANDPMTEQEIQVLLGEEVAMAAEADIVISVSSSEAKIFEKNGIESIHVLGFSVPVDPTPNDFATRDGLLFIGGIHEDDSPNADSLRWFASDILPLLRVKLGKPDLRLKVVGLNRSPSIAALDGIAFDLLGQVRDLRPHINAARLLVAPTRFAAGLPHKISHAASLGLPVVATDLLVDQLNWRPGRDILSASGPEDFADACARLFQDEAMWRGIREAALQRCSEEGTPEHFRATVAQILALAPERPSESRNPTAPKMHDYSDWIRAYDTLSARDRLAIRHHIAAFKYRPLISVIIPTFNTPEPWLRRCIESVIDQVYSNWELCLADDASTEPHVAAICQSYAEKDLRIRFVQREQRGHIAAASNSALHIATGEFVALLDHDDELADQALYMVVAALQNDPQLDLLFTDEDKIDEHSVRREPWFKPNFDPDLMRSQNAVVHLAVYRRSLLNEIGGFRSGFDGSQDYDVTLRFAEKTIPSRIRRLPYVLYHWRAISGSVALTTDQKIYPYEAGLRAIQEHLGRIGARAHAAREPHLGYYRVQWELPERTPRVTLIIPTRNKVDLLRNAVESIIRLTDYPNYEILIIDNGSDEPETLAYLREICTRPEIRVIQDLHPYSFAGLNNRAVSQTDAEVVGFLNNDVEVISPSWLREMVSHACRPEVGAVGAKLYYPDRSLQHTGIVVGIGGLAGHPHLGQAADTLGYFGRAAVIQRYSAVTAACLVMRRSVFLELDGFDDENFAIAFNDVDLGMRLCRAGYAVIWTPYAEFIHHESASLGPPDSDGRRSQFERECANLRRLWPDFIADDPAYNPNLTITGGDFLPSFPPRTRKPWLDYA